MPAIDVRGLEKSYGDFGAVRGISFTVDEGEIVAVLGPNGAGKTTMVEILEGYRRRTAGYVDVLGFDPERGGSDMRRRIGIVLQECGADPYLTVREILVKHAEYYPSPRGVDEVVELVGLADKSDSRVKALSGGQKRRLDVALGLVGDPELLFLDEPTTGFDPTARRQAWEVVHQLRALGKTVLLTTHYMDEAQALADRVIVIGAGRIIAEGSPESIGGRSEANAVVRMAPPPGTDTTALPPGFRTDTGGAIEYDTPTPTALVADLIDWGRGVGLDELPSLEVARPSLEDVYLELVSDVDDDRSVQR